MLYNAENGNLKMGDTDMDYIAFGYGTKNLIFIPGLGDGLMTVRGKVLPFAWMYRLFANDFRVYVFSRKNELPEGYTTRDMARDLKTAMYMLGIVKADIIGVSQGGMIAEFLAIDYPQVVNHLILVVTTARKNAIIQEAIDFWQGLASQNRFGALMRDVTVRMYSEEYMKKYRYMLPLFNLYPAPKNPKRFAIMADACVTHNAYDELEKISAPTLVIGGEKDITVGGDASRELADKIRQAELFMYPEYGHGLYEEAKDFNQRIYDYLMRE